MSNLNKAEPILYFEGFVGSHPGTPGIPYKAETIDKMLVAFCDVLREAASSDSPNKFTEIERLAHIGHQLVRTKSFSLEDFVGAGGRIDKLTVEGNHLMLLDKGSKVTLTKRENATQGNEAMQSGTGTPIVNQGPTPAELSAAGTTPAVAATPPSPPSTGLMDKVHALADKADAERRAASADPRELPRVLVEGIRDELKRLVDGKVEDNLIQIQSVCQRANELFMVLRGATARFNQHRGPGSYPLPGVYGGLDSSVTIGAPMVTDYGYVGSSVSPQNNPEQFGAKAIRELVSLIPEVLAAHSNSPEKLMAAIALAKEKGHDEIAATLTERLLGKQEKDDPNVITTRVEHLHVALPPGPSGDVTGSSTLNSVADADPGLASMGIGPMIPPAIPTSTHVCTNADVDETVGMNGVTPA